MHGNACALRNEDVRGAAILGKVCAARHRMTLSRLDMAMLRTHASRLTGMGKGFHSSEGCARIAGDASIKCKVMTVSLRTTLKSVCMQEFGRGGASRLGVTMWTKGCLHLADEFVFQGRGKVAPIWQYEGLRHGARRGCRRG